MKISEFLDGLVANPDAGIVCDHRWVAHVVTQFPVKRPLFVVDDEVLSVDSGTRGAQETRVRAVECDLCGESAGASLTAQVREFFGEVEGL
jgi:hypothetical protein